MARLVKKNKKESPESPNYIKITENKTTKGIVKSMGCLEYSECNCKPNHDAPCSFNSGCLNAVVEYECDPKLCPAKEKCQNQNFHCGEKFILQAKMTKSTGWGLFTEEAIPADHFVIEYKGEIINSEDFSKRFHRFHYTQTAKKKDKKAK